MSTWVITGANRGLGLELTRKLAARGEDVIGTARSADRAEELKALPVRVEQLDVTDGASVAALAAALGDLPVDYLINNAGKGGRGPGIEELDWDLVLPYFEVNALGPMRVTQALLPNLRAGKERVIAHISTQLASISDNASGGSYAYRSSKAALNMLNRSLARELEDEGFTCVLLHPGWVKTALGGPMAPLSADESAAELLEVLGRLSPAQNGQFLDRAGRQLPW